MKKKELQVLYIVTKLELGGAQKVCLSLYNELAKQGNRTLLVSGNEGTLVNKLPHNDTIYLFDTFKREISFKNVWIECKNFFRLIRFIRKKRKEYPHLIIHTHSTKAGIIGRWAAFFAGVSTRIHTIHGFGFHPYQHRCGWITNYILELVTSLITTHYVCVSSYDIKTGITFLPHFAKKSSIIRASVDQQKFISALKTTTHNETFVFGTVSCFKKQKNLFDLLQAFKYCHQQKPQIKLEIIGDGHLKASIKTWIKKNNLESAIIMLGWQHNVVEYMHSWQAFVLSSLWEGLPCAIVEARLLKLPVISYNTGGIHDVIIHNENGLLSKPKNWFGLANDMLKLSTDKKLYQKLKNFNDNLYDFDLEIMIKNHIELYKKF